MPAPDPIILAKLRYLVREVCNGIEIYFTGRSDGQYFKTAFILCDDYTELLSKLFLISGIPGWSDTHDKEAKKYAEAQKRILDAIRTGVPPDLKDVERLEKGQGRDRFKGYHDVMNNLDTFFKEKRQNEAVRLTPLQTEMKRRRELRNGFFHSADLLGLNVSKADCVEAFCDLLDYGALLFPNEWKQEMEGAGTLETLEVLLRLEKQSIRTPSLTPKVNRILSDWPCNVKRAKTKGVLVAEHPEDMHLRLCVVHGGLELKDRLNTLLKTGG